MRRIFGLLLLATLCVGLPFHSQQLHAMFTDYKREYNRTYSGPEERQRFQCYVSNLHRIEELNKMEPAATFGVNLFTDLCPEEFRAKYLTGLLPSHRVPSSRIKKLELPQATPPNPPKSVDWLTKQPFINAWPVQDQGQCGSCWAFSAVAAMEAGWNIKFGSSSSFLKLSEGYVNSCSMTDGCSGGWPDDAIDFVIQNGGIPSTKIYGAYVPKSGNCTMPKGKVTASAFFLAKLYPPQGTTVNEPLLAVGLSTYGPLSIALDATAFQSYKSGVLGTTSCPNNGINHAVALTGVYGAATSSASYWIIRNSWGISWGEKGYVRVAFGKNCYGMTKYMVWAVPQP